MGCEIIKSMQVQIVAAHEKDMNPSVLPSIGKIVQQSGLSSISRTISLQE